MKKALTIMIVLACMISLTGCKSSDYKEAVSLMESKDYSGAAEIFSSLTDYKDSASLLDECNKMIEAINAFTTAANNLEAQNAEMKDCIDTASALVYSEEKALDESIRPNVETAISSASAALVDVPSQPESYDDLVGETNKIEKIDYSSVLSELKSQTEALSKSIKQYSLVNNPAEAYVIECLKSVEGVVDIAAATEDNDPNGKLHKAGGYTSAVYFSYDKVNQNSISGSTIIEKGTDCGGQLEVYANEDDAKKRNEYLSTFDGTPFSSGSHTVLGTIVVRTSDELTASQQKELEEKIIASLINIE